MSTDDRPGHDDLREGDLLAYLDGEARPAAAAHIAGCPRCQEELAGLRAAAALLGAALDRAACPEPERLLRYQAGLLGAGEAGEVARHAAGCADCAAELALLAAPPELSPAERLARAGVRVVRALLQPGPPPALALRGRAIPARRAHFAGEGYQILVVVEPGHPAGGRFQIEGQVLAPDGARAGAARLSGSAQEEQEAEVDDLGFFAFDDVGPGAYTLAVALAGAHVVTEILVVP